MSTSTKIVLGVVVVVIGIVEFIQWQDRNKCSELASLAYRQNMDTSSPRFQNGQDYFNEASKAFTQQLQTCIDQNPYLPF